MTRAGHHQEVTERRNPPPTWVRTGIGGAVFGIIFGAFTSFSTNWIAASVTGLLTGTAFGVLMHVQLRKTLAATADGMSGLTAQQRRQARRANLRGSVPADPAVRLAAAAAVEANLDLMTRRKTIFSLIFAGGALLEVAVGISGATWGWPAAALFAFMLVVQLYLPGRLERRLRRLRS